MLATQRNPRVYESARTRLRAPPSGSRRLIDRISRPRIVNLSGAHLLSLTRSPTPSLSLSLSLYLPISYPLHFVLFCSLTLVFVSRILLSARVFACSVFFCSHPFIFTRYGFLFQKYRRDENLKKKKKIIRLLKS